MPHARVRSISGFTRHAGLRRAAARLRAAQRVVITTHLHPDPDAIGSSLALAAALDGLGIPVDIIIGSPMPKRYAFMDDAQRIRALDESEELPEADVVVIFDSSAGWDRLGTPGASNCDPLRARQATVITSTITPIHISLQYPRCRSTGHCSVSARIHLVLLLTDTLSPQQAGWLYLGIVTDTSSFRFPNTNPEAYRIVADLADRGGESASTVRRNVRAHFSGAIALAW